jgi:hypothetical protein
MNESAARPRKGMSMRDFVADWNRWSRAERVLAIVVTMMILALPLGLMITGKPGI